MKKVKKIMTVLACVMLICGIGLFSYPYISQMLFQRQADAGIAGFLSAVEENASDTDMLQKLYAQMQAYNENLYLTGQSGLVDPFSYEQPSFDLSKFGFSENIVGYIAIPKIDVRMPICLGASKENMKKGAVHLSQTSLPIGGENTNCVIAAHRGSTRGLMFRNIHKLEIGDEIGITNFMETLTYRVAEIKIILPDEIDQVMICPGEDMVTLISCNPLGRNYQRYVVYAKRV